MATEIRKSTASNQTIQRMALLYESKKGADVHFVFEEDGQSKRVSAHKNILAASGKAFHNMFNGKSKKEGDIKIVGYSVTEFDVFLQVIYHKLDAMNMENVGDVIDLAQKFGCDRIMEICKKFLIENVSVDNVCSVWPLCYKIYSGHNEVTQRCENITKANWKTIINTGIFIESEWETFRGVYLCVPISDRIKKDVIERIMEWVKRSCEKKSIDASPENWRKELYPWFDFSYFKKMDLGQFIEFEQSYPIFGVDEYKKIIADIYAKLEGSSEAKKRKNSMDLPKLMN